MESSDSGKTTLLNVLAHRNPDIKLDVVNNVEINGFTISDVNL